MDKHVAEQNNNNQVMSGPKWQQEGGPNEQWGGHARGYDPNRPTSKGGCMDGEIHTPRGSENSYDGKKRDYFESQRYDDSDGMKSPRYDEDSNYSSYSALEDNNAVTSKKIRDDIPDSDLIDYEDDGGDSLVDSVPEMEYDESRIRIFIALFDYDPVTMSPNPDAIDEELPFKEGQLIKVDSCLSNGHSLNGGICVHLGILMY